MPVSLINFSNTYTLNLVRLSEHILIKKNLISLVFANKKRLNVDAKKATCKEFFAYIFAWKSWISWMLSESFQQQITLLFQRGLAFFLNSNRIQQTSFFFCCFHIFCFSLADERALKGYPKPVMSVHNRFCLLLFIFPPQLEVQLNWTLWKWRQQTETAVETHDRLQMTFWSSFRLLNKIYKSNRKKKEVCWILLEFKKKLAALK